jgi:aspartate kinase
MRVHKFGGASIKDVEGVKRVADIIKTFPESGVVVVVSAMGKTTNLLEEVVHAHYNGMLDRAFELMNECKKQHFAIIDELFPQAHGVRDEVNNLFVELEWTVEDPPRDDYDYNYDQIVGYGELISSRIVSAYLADSGFKHDWLDARDIIKTDNRHRDARIDWQLCGEQCRRYVKKEGAYLTQGYIGCTSENFNTTLGREGSDYTAAIFAFLMEADEVCIWKDVPGLMNADPNEFSDSKLLERVSFEEAIELAFFGAKVIHPKTIQPLKKKGIALRVKSFLNPVNAGSLISSEVEEISQVPSYIVKHDQVLLNISARDLSFIAEHHLSFIFGSMAEHGFRVNMMQNSAVSFSVVLDQDQRKLANFVQALENEFDVEMTGQLSLYTVRHYADQWQKLLKGRAPLLEQRTSETIQLLLTDQ